MSDQIRKRKITIRATAVVAIVVSGFFVVAMTTIYFLTRSDVNKEIDALLDRRKAKVESSMVRDTHGSDMYTTIDSAYDSSIPPGEDYDDLLESLMENSYYPGNANYIDPDGDTIEIWYLSLGGYGYRSFLGFSFGVYENEERLNYYLITDFSGITEESTDNKDLRSSLESILQEGKTRGFEKSYRYLVFKVPCVLSGKHFYVETAFEMLESNNTHYVLTPDIGPMHAKTDRQYLFEGRNGEEMTVYLPVILFEDTSSYKQAYAFRMFRYVLILLAIGLAFILLTWILERTLKGITSSDTNVEKVIETDSPAGVLSEEKARTLLYHIEQAEQSMGPNGYLDEIRKDLKAILGKEEKEEVE